MVRATLWYTMVMPPMTSSCIAAVRADGKAVSPCLFKSSPSGDPAWKRKNQAVCAALPAHLASLVRACPLGSKKVAQLPPFHTTLVAPDTEDSTSTTLVVDELWSCVLKTAGKVSVWIAQCRKTQQVVAYAVGDRSKKTCQQLWEAIASTYRQGHCFTDFWVAYKAVIPEKQHTAVGKETGETAHVERWNNTALAAPGALCPHDAVVSRVVGHARILFAPLSSSLQPRTGHTA